MNRPAPRRFAWLFNRRSGMALLCTALVIGTAFIVNLVGIGVVGDVQRWTQWLQDHAGYFFVWRLCLYSATAYLWWRTRARLLRRSPSPEARQRLQHIGIISLVAVAGFEIMTYLRHA